MSRPRKKKTTETQSAPRSSPEYPLDERLAELFGLGGDVATTGVRVNEATALNCSAVYAAVTLVAQSLATLPIKIYRKDKDGKRSEAPEHPAYNILNWSPDDEMPSFNFREVIVGHTCLRGYGVAEIERNYRGQAKRFHLLDPRRVTCTNQNGRRQYIIREDKGDKTLERSQVFHIVGYSWDGFMGKSPITLARETIGLSMAAEKYGSTFFGKGGRPMGFLTKPTLISDKQRKQLRKEWKELHEGLRNALSIGVLSGGLDWKDVGTTPEDAQFLATRKFQIYEIARWFRVPPHMLAELDGAKYNNIEAMLIEFMLFCLFPWVCRLEAELNMKLFTPDESFRYYAEFNLDAFMRADTSARYAAIEKQLRNGLLTPDEGRAMDNRDPYPDGIGSKPLIMASQLATLEDVATGKVDLTGKRDKAQTGGQTADYNPFNQLVSLFSILPREDLDRAATILDVMRGRTAAV